jgi:hypothetical protein
MIPRMSIPSTDRGALAEGFAATVMGGLEEASGPTPGDAARAIGIPARWATGGVIGKGGMGRVLEATDLWFGRRVALKELLVDDAPPALVRRFTLEALVTGNLEHPGIAAVYERGVRDGRPYYVMRKLEGRTVADALARASNLRERLQLVPMLVRVAQTIAFAHERGVIHRDLKPENVVLGTHGEVTVIDWGIARVRRLDRLGIEAGSLSEASRGPAAHTVTGAVLGTPAYMAPEQAAGDIDAIDERTDVFALGALLYHVLAGRPPFEADTAEALVVKALEVDCPPLASVAPRAPSPLVAICERAMSKDRASRFRAAKELAEALEGALTDALTGGESRVVNVLTAAISVAVVASGIVGSVTAWQLVPSFEEVGWGIFTVIGAALFGGLFVGLEFASKGRHQLSSLVLTFTGLTFLAGLVTATVGVFKTLHGALRPEILGDEAAWRQSVTVGAYESLGSAIAGGAMAAMLLILWGITSRRTARARARNARA